MEPAATTKEGVSLPLPLSCSPSHLSPASVSSSLLLPLLPCTAPQGIPTVERAVINDVGGGKYNLLVEG